MKKHQQLIFSCLLIAFLWSCQSKPNPPKINKAYHTEIENWRQERLADLTDPNGWLSLAGLFWLKEGENTFGSSSRNKIRFPKNAAMTLGSFDLNADGVSMNIHADVTVYHADTLVTSMFLLPDISGKPSILFHGSLNWNLIKRADNYGIRLRDTLNENIANFKGLDYFPIDESWKMKAQFIPYDDGKMITMKNVLKMDVEQKLEGQLKFEKDGQSYTLDMLDGGPEEYFIVFADETTGMESYGGGRYLYCNRADSTGFTTIDFNKAHTPPCGFTDFATCLLPPSQNRLEVLIKAGESYKGH